MAVPEHVVHYLEIVTTDAEATRDLYAQPYGRRFRSSTPGGCPRIILPIVLVMAAPACAPAPADECAACTIQVEHIARIGAEDGPGAMPACTTGIASDSRGRWYVTAPCAGERATIFVYGADGRFLRRLGSAGEGPGEFRSTAAVTITGGDSLFVYDDVLGRVTVFSPEYEVVRTLNGIPHYYRAIELADGTFIANAKRYPGEPLFRFDRGGRVLGWFGEKRTEFEPLFEYLRVLRFLAPAAGGGVWSAKRGFEYAITRWSPSGEKLEELRPRRTWFPAYEMGWGPSPDRPPVPTLQGIWQSTDGLLWVVARVPDADWRAGLGARRHVEGREVYEIDDAERVFDTVFEVVDPVVGPGALYARRLDGAEYAPVGDGIVASMTVTDLGFMLIDLWQVQLGVEGPER